MIAVAGEFKGRYSRAGGAARAQPAGQCCDAAHSKEPQPNSKVALSRRTHARTSLSGSTLSSVSCSGSSSKRFRLTTTCGRRGGGCVCASVWRGDVVQRTGMAEVIRMGCRQSRCICLPSTHPTLPSRPTAPWTWAAAPPAPPAPAPAARAAPPRRRCPASSRTPRAAAVPPRPQALAGR